MTSALCSFNGHQLGCPRNLVPIKEFLSWLITTYFSDLQPTLKGLFQRPRSDVRDPNAVHIFLVLGLPWENPLACSIEAMLPITVVSINLSTSVSFEIGSCWVVVSNIFYFHPYLGKIPNLTNIFQMG